MDHSRHKSLIRTFGGYAVRLFAGVIVMYLVIGYSASAVASSWIIKAKQSDDLIYEPIFILLMKQAGIATAAFLVIGFGGIHRGLGRLPSYGFRNYRFSLHMGLAACLAATFALYLPFLIGYGDWYVFFCASRGYRSYSGALGHLVREPAVVISILFLAAQALLGTYLVVNLRGVPWKAKAWTMGIAVAGIAATSAIGYALMFNYGWSY